MKNSSLNDKKIEQKRSYCVHLLFLFLFFVSSQIYSQTINEQWVKSNYSKREVMIPMRDGTRLYTAIYEPCAHNQKSPILIYRSPYGSHPYGSDFNSSLWNSLKGYIQKKYIIVYQDVRGKRMSEGEYENIRPIHLFAPKGQTDDETDMTAKVPMIDTKIEMVGISVERKSCKKTYTTIITSKIASSNVFTTSYIEA